MKKILFLTLSIVMLLSNSAITSAHTSGVDHSIPAYQTYTFVGNFSFTDIYPDPYGYGTVASESLDVYEQCKVIDGNIISTYYARYDGRYYKLIPCKVTSEKSKITYNYYISLNSRKMYVRI